MKIERSASTHNILETNKFTTMSLYTFSHSNRLFPVKMPAGLRIEASTDISMLSKLCIITIEDATNRLANGNLAFVAYINDQPAAFGWMARDNAKIGELNHEFVLPTGNRYLWNFRTLEAYRGLGIYPALLQYILQNGDNSANRFWIIHAPENNASLKGITKAGFEYVGKLYVDGNGTTTIEASDTALSFQEQLEYMYITLSGQTATSCWNCSSPYLKKRSAECCCATVSAECIGNSMLAMAA